MLEADRREIYRYLGLRGREPDAGTAQTVEEAVAALESAVERRSSRTRC